jgi:hypothetical protein
VVVPDIDAGADGIALALTDKVAVLLPQVLFAVMEIVPLVEPAIAVIELFVELPLQPLGTIHV